MRKSHLTARQIADRVQRLEEDKNERRPPREIQRLQNEIDKLESLRPSDEDDGFDNPTPRFPEDLIIL